MAIGLISSVNVPRSFDELRILPNTQARIVVSVAVRDSTASAGRSTTNLTLVAGAATFSPPNDNGLRISPSNTSRPGVAIQVWQNKLASRVAFLTTPRK